MDSSKYLIVEHLTTKELTRIFSKIKVNPLTKCWEWQNQLSGGYGLVRFHGKIRLVHRVLYAWAIGPIPDGVAARKFAQLDHVVCNNCRCCNPAHLELTTQRANCLRGNGPSAINARKTHCPKGHPLPSEPNVASRRERTCKECRRIFEESKHRKAYKKQNGKARYEAVKSDPEKYKKLLAQSRINLRRSRQRRKELLKATLSNTPTRNTT